MTSISPADAGYYLHRAEREAIQAIQATSAAAAAIHQDLSRRYSGIALAWLGERPPLRRT